MLPLFANHRNQSVWKLHQQQHYYYEESAKFQILSYFWRIFFSVHSCKLVLLLPLLVITKEAKLSVFKCIEVFWNQGAKYFNAYSLASISLQAADSMRSFVAKVFIVGMCSWLILKNCYYCRTTNIWKKGLFWLNHTLLMVLYLKICCFSKILIL